MRQSRYAAAADASDGAAETGSCSVASPPHHPGALRHQRSGAALRMKRRPLSGMASHDGVCEHSVTVNSCQRHIVKLLWTFCRKLFENG